ncbi:MAG: sugar ABC transporter substrate-binding protein [Clostridia bacterium]
MRKNRTLLVSLVLLLVMLLPSNSFATPQEGHLEIWSMLTQVERADSFEKMARNYEAAHPGITINVTVMPWSGALDKLVAAIMAGNAPDITVVGNGYPQTLAGMGGLVELSEVVEKVGGKDAFLGTSLTVQGAYENGLYAMPLYVTPYVAYYRQSWLDKAGIKSTPTTWEEYYEMCKAVTNPAENRYGFALPLGDLHGWKTIWSFLQCNGVDIVNVGEDGAWYVDMNDESRAAMIETYDYLYKLCKDCAPEGIVSYTQTNVRELVASGVVMSRIDTPEIYYNVKSMDPDNLSDVSYFTIPGRKQFGSGQGWVGLCVTKDANVELASDYLEYLFNEDTMVDFFVSYPYAMFPAKAELFGNAAYQSSMPEEIKGLVPDMALDILNTASSLCMNNGPFPVSGEMESQCILGNGLVKMLVDDYSAEQAVDYVLENIASLME